MQTHYSTQISEWYSINYKTNLNSLELALCKTEELILSFI